MKNKVLCAIFVFAGYDRGQGMEMYRNKQVLGITLAVLGLLFFLVQNHLLWFGWEAVWPLLIVIAGAFLFRIFASRRGAEHLFGGLSLVLLGIFFLLFSSGALEWRSMASLWPTFLLIAGLALVAVSGLARSSTGPLVVGVVAIALAASGYFYTAGVLDTRVASFFIRTWPLVLLFAGVTIFLRAKRELEKGSESEADCVSALDSSDFQRALEDCAEGEEAIRRTVRWLKDRFPGYSWVGVYRREGETLVLDPDKFVGPDPEHKRIRIPEGICGQAAHEKRTVIVPDVRKSERYLACSPFTRSEIVVPLVKGEEVYGVLDIDSDDLDAFGEGDRIFLEHVACELIRRL